MTDDYQRPDPDELLERVKNDELQKKRGKLKIFMGYAAGVGKTYAMLEAAHQRKREGLDVVVAYVETHRRAETEALTDNLESIPCKDIEYRGTHLTEMDVDATLARKPQLALVDELAHTNAPGSRHPKRYLDVEDLLSAGIDVYTTLNIQHLESLNDVVQQITGVTVHETVPDHIMEEANEIELIDLTPDELLVRLREGKVYVPEQAARAIEQFFRKGNLTALREIAMRHAAQQVDVQMRDYMETKSIAGPWPAKDRLMVAISSHPMGERLVRTGRRLAEYLDAEWFVVYVETPERLHSTPAYNERISRTMNLAEELGAKVTTISGRTVPEAVIDFAHKNNITKIIAGKPLRPRWSEKLRGSVLDEILRRSGAIDVYVISEESGSLQPEPAKPIKISLDWRAYLQSLLIVAIVTVFGTQLARFIQPINLAMLYLAAVVLTAVYLGRGPSMLAALLGVLSLDFFFINPRFSFSVSDTQYIITFLGLFVVGLVISNLAGKVRDQVEASRQSESQMATLYSLSRDLTNAFSLDLVMQTIIRHIGQTFSREVVLLLPRANMLEQRAASADFILDQNELAVANWAYQHGHPAGRGTDTLPAGRVRYQPLVTSRGVIGVLGIKPGDTTNYLTRNQREMLDAYASLAALAIERTELADAAGQAMVLSATEKLQTALLNSISHDLRTPMVSITGVLDALFEAEKDGPEAVVLSHDARREMLQTARSEAGRLNRLVGNLLEMTLVESGTLKIKREDTDLAEVVWAAVEQMGDKLGAHPVKVDFEPGIPQTPIDFVLIEQVIINLLENAAKYSPQATQIQIIGRKGAGTVELAVIDDGIGIPPEDLTRVFDKFYRVQRKEEVKGTGLGLSICKGIIEAHGGQIRAENRENGGTTVIIDLPIEFPG
jgi:two-component system, OmpR family, sensor histidine kinase KdpD